MSTEDRPGRSWEVLSRDLAFAAPSRVEVYRETVRLPDGRVIDDYWQTVERSFAVIFAETAAGEIILLKSYKHGPRREHLGLPGGHIDPGEAPIEAARRELLEETGYGGGAWSELGRYCTAGNQGGAVAHAFRCKGAVKLAEPKPGDLEELTLQLMGRRELAEAIARGEFAVAGDLAAVALAWARV